MDELVERLMAQPLLAGLPQEVIEDEVAPSVQPMELREEHILYTEGSPPTYLYLVETGELEALSGEGDETHRINMVYAGEYCGDTALLFGARQPVTIRALTPCTILVMHGPAFLDLYERHAVVRHQHAQLSRAIEQRSHLTYEGKEPDEIVLSINRRHWMALLIALLPGLFLLATLLLVVLLAVVFLRNSPALLQTVVLWTSIAVVVWSGGLGLWHVIDWYNDYLIITDRQVIHIERVLLISVQRTTIPMEKVQNVDLDQSSPIERALSYGRIEVVTAAIGEGIATIIMGYMPDPRAISDLIIREANRSRVRLTFTRAEEQRQQLLRTLGREPGVPPQSAATQPTARPYVRDQKKPRHRGRFQSLIAYLRPTVREVDEEGSIIWRRHWLNVLWLSLATYIALAVVLAALAIAAFGLDLDRGEALALMGLGAVALAFLGGRLLWIYEDWRNDRYVLMADSIIDEKQSPLGFRKNRRRAPLDRIQDIQVRQGNPLYVWLDIGDVLIQTAGAQGSFTFDFVWRPREVQAAILQAIRAHQNRQLEQQSQRTHEELRELIKLYDEIQQEDDARAPRPTERWPRSPAEATTRRQLPASEATTRQRPSDPAL